MISPVLLFALNGVAILFDLLNRLHDAANSIATSAIVLSPAIGLVLAMLLVLITSWGFRRFTPRAADATFRKLQLLSAAAYSLGHGGNDVQVSMRAVSHADKVRTCEGDL